ncbi:MAG TPA: hypothetical protein VFR35_02650 [Actinoplanes sp.]|nr:hypothetical protein [Actinoplanes sp.]
MPFTRFIGNAVCVLTLAVPVAFAGVTSAFAVGSRPQPAPSFNGSVYAIAQRGSTVYVGGSFTSATAGGRSYPRLRLAAFDAHTGALLNWAPAADRTVRALAVSGTAVYAGGDFGTISGVRRDNLARLDAATGAVGSFAHRVSGAPYALTTGNGRLYAGGSFTAVDGFRRDNLAAFSLGGDMLDAGWRPRADDAVHALTAYRSKVFLGGGFHTVNEVRGSLRIAAVDGARGSVDRGFLPGAPAEVNAIAVDPAGVYAATGGQGGRAIAYAPGGSVRWQRLFDGDAVAIAALDGVTYVGGHFDRACLTLTNGPQGTCIGGSVPRVKLAAVHRGGGLTTWSPQANGVIGVRVLSVDPSRGAIAAGGDFTMINGEIRRRYAVFS